MRKENYLVKKFIDFEESQKLFEKKNNGISSWSFIRDKVFSLIQEATLDYSEKGKRDINSSLREIAIKAPSFLKNFFSFPLKEKKETTLLFIAHPRRKFMQGSYYDIYTDPLINDIKCSFSVIEPMFQLTHYTPVKTDNIYYLDFIDIWSRGRSLINRDKLTDEERQYWNGIDKSLRNTFQYKGKNIRHLIELEETRYRLAYPHIKSMLKSINPDLIIEVVSYQRMAKFINIVAKELNIPTVELQHGYVGKHHIAYNYPENSMNESFPDYFFTWGEFWKKNIKLPIDKKKIFVTGFHYFNKHVSSYLQGKKSKNKTILFISQATLGKKLAEKAIELSNKNLFKDYNILFKLHPTEFRNENDKYSDLYKHDKIKVLDSSFSGDLYDLIFESSIVCGVYSTAIIEALGLGKKVIVFKIPGWEAMQEFYDDDFVNIEIVDDVETLLNSNIIEKKNNELESRKEYLFAPSNYSCLKLIADIDCFKANKEN